MGPHLRCDSLDTILPNGIKVAQCTPLLHQRDLPSLVKLAAWRRSLLFKTFSSEDVFFTGKVKRPAFLPYDSHPRGDGAPSLATLRRASDLFLLGGKKPERYGKF